MTTTIDTWATMNDRFAPLVSALGTQTDQRLTVAVAATLDREQRRDWLDGWDACRTGIGSGRADVDATWTREIVWHAFPGDAPQWWRDAETLADETDAAADDDGDYGRDIDGILA